MSELNHDPVSAEVEPVAKSPLPERWLRRLKWGAILGGALVVWILLLDQVIMPWYTRHGQAVEVPGVIGMPVEKARQLLVEQGFRVVEDERRFDSTYPSGYVVEQNPGPQRPVKEGRRIHLVVSLGERTVKVPRLIELDETQARLTLKNLQLRVGEIEGEFSYYYPENIVLDQSIPPGTEVEIGTAVDLTVSNGRIPSEFVVPFVEGKTLDRAKREIEKAGLTVGEIIYRDSDEFLPETVLRQSIPAGTVVSQGDTLNLEVSRITGKRVGLKEW
jgi:serine/threonine-protein kinase